MILANLTVLSFKERIIRKMEHKNQSITTSSRETNFVFLDQTSLTIFRDKLENERAAPLKVCPLHTGRLCHCSILDESIYHFRGVRAMFVALLSFFIFDEKSC